MNAIIGIGFETSFEKFIESGKKLEIPINKISFKKEVKDKLDIFLERILLIAKPFAIIDNNLVSSGLSYSKEFERVKNFVDKEAKIGFCVYSTRENYELSCKRFMEYITF